MLTGLTIHQASLIRSLQRQAKGVTFHGIDQNDLPVLSFVDARRRTEPFAVLRRSVRTGLVLRGRLCERTTAEPAYPLRWFSETESNFIDPEAHELLTGLEVGFVGQSERVHGASRQGIDGAHL